MGDVTNLPESATSDITTALGEVTHAAEQVREWEHTLLVCLESARAEGASIAALAQAAGVTRQTVYRWMGGKRKRSKPTRRALDDGLEALLIAGVGPSATADITSALRSNDLTVKAGRMVRGIRGLPRPVNELDQEARDTIRLGIAAGSAVLANPGNVPGRIVIDDDDV